MTKVFDFFLNLGFSLIFIFLPLIFLPQTSEVFEFNKIVFLYLMTSIIVFSWLGKSILQKRFIFRRTILDLPLLLFLGSQIISTIFSMDKITSIFGYYSRFNGSLLSLLSYSLLYWAYVSNIKKKKTTSHFLSLIIVSLFISIYGILQHFGIDKNYWETKVQTRVFATLGQPNWLAAWIVATMPLSWVLLLGKYLKLKNKSGAFNNLGWIFGLFISTLQFTTLLFTKSRSGFLGFIFSDIIFWFGILIYLKTQSFKNTFPIKSFLLLHFIYLVLIFLVGFPINLNFFQKKIILTKITNLKLDQKLETIGEGGTDSGKIRKLVWEGAIEVWKHNLFIGSGVETFAYSFYQFRPQSHNLASEWDFLYNKAHNEYLNFAATTGTLGLFSYLFLIGVSLYAISIHPKISVNFQKNKILNKSKSEFEYSLNPKNSQLINIALFSSYFSILITNFFGFSVAPISFLFFIFPGIAFTITKEEPKIRRENHFNKVNLFQKMAIILTFSGMIFLEFLIIQYWYADTLYAKAKKLNTKNNFLEAKTQIEKAISITPWQPIYWDELSHTYANCALLFSEESDSENSQVFTQSALQAQDYALEISPKNLNLLKSKASIFLKLSQINPQLLSKAKDSLGDVIIRSPTDAKLYYNLGLVEIRLNDFKKGELTLKQAIELKENYKDAHFALALLYVKTKEFKKAQDELNFILKYIDPKDKLTIKALQNLPVTKN